VNYPPEQHLLRDLQAVNWLEGPDHGVAELQITDAVRDSSGRVCLGALITLADIACTRVALSAVAPHFVATLDLSVTTAARPTDGLVRTDATLRYLAQTKVGPASATASVIRRTADHAIVDVTVRDAGAGGALLARALVGATP
jgi:acyl-coenzyme A thioesterase PaaI-like protein